MTVFNALKSAQAFRLHEELSQEYESASQENMFSMALAETCDSDDCQLWLRELSINIYTSHLQDELTNEAPDIATIYKNKLNGA